MSDDTALPSTAVAGALTPVPWGLGAALGVLAITAGLIVGLAAAAGRLVDVEQVPLLVRRLLLPLPLVLLGLVTVGWVHVRYRAVSSLFGVARPELRHWVSGVGWGAAMFFLVNIVLGLIVQGVAQLIGVELPQPQARVRELALDPVVLPWLVVTAVIVAPLAEELFFRGMLYQGLRRHFSVPWSVVLSALAFGAAHMIAEPTGATGTLVLALILPVGLFLGWLLERKGTLIVPFVAHATFNLATMLILIGTARLAPVA